MITAGWDVSRFESTLREYLRVTSRTLPKVVNTKLYYIARKAVWFTQKADVEHIRSELGRFVTVSELNRKGKTVKRRRLVLAPARSHNAPLAALIVNKRRGVGKGLYGAAMARAVREMVAARSRSTAFLKSGFLPGVKKLAPFADKAGQPAMDSSAKVIGRAKGDGQPANEMDFNPVAFIVNEASALRDRNTALFRVAGKGLEIAFDDETASMLEYIERKMNPDAQDFNRKQG